MVNMLTGRGGEYELVFRYFDENGDGKLSASELREKVGLIGGELLLTEAETAVKALDSDGDGLLGLDDFVQLMEGVGEEEKLRDLREAFGMYEVDRGCGYITPTSLRRMLSRLGKSNSIHECEVMIGRFDLDGNGVISFNEFKAMMMP